MYILVNFKGVFFKRLGITFSFIHMRFGLNSCYTRIRYGVASISNNTKANNLSMLKKYHSIQIVYKCLYVNDM